MMDAIDIQYAPCYKNIADRIENLVGFKPIKQYDDMLIKPRKISNNRLITDEWSDIQHVAAALLMQDTAQNVVVSKLCSRDNQSKLKRALWEYNNIHFSIYMLRYIDDTVLRRAVRIALNRGEAYNKLYSTVEKVGGGKFRGQSDLEVEIWHQCTRLITLVIIYYNMYMLSKLVEEKLAQGDEQAAKLLERVSPLVSRHINIGGIYNYADDCKGTNDMESIIAALNEALEELRANQKKVTENQVKFE